MATLTTFNEIVEDMNKLASAIRGLQGIPHNDFFYCIENKYKPLYDRAARVLGLDIEFIGDDTNYCTAIVTVEETT